MLVNKTIVLGITGSIAAYKGADLASKLTQAGAKVEVIMTESATKFVSPTTFRSLTNRRVVTDMFELSSEFSLEHVALAEAADVVVIAPATANIIAKIATGIAYDMLSCTVLATKAPVIIAPAMHSGMWENSVTKENVARLKARGITFVEPGYGRLASGGIGHGRLAEIEKIIGTISQVLGKKGDLAGKRIVVTAGGTREDIDPVRFVGNRSSGKMGFAVAEAARDRGAKVTLITAPTALPDPVGIEVTHITSAVQMKEAVTKATAQCDALIMAAAVADYMPKSAARGKIKKAVVGESMTLELKRTPDILSDVKGDFIRVGFAAETTENLLQHARKDELIKKNLDLVAANDITIPGAGFDVDTNIVTLIDRKGKVENLPLMSKREVADKILDRVVGMMGKKAGGMKNVTHRRRKV
jgi:phosphopantothenoylcysteine decarboxylase/phosphopantothenate--cysteine ligase